MPRGVAVEKAVSYTPEQQREMTSENLGLAQAVTGRAAYRTRDPQTGRQVEVGEMDMGRVQQRGVAYDAHFDNMKAAMLNRHARAGVQAATVISFLPIPLIVNSPMVALKNVRIEPCLGDMPYAYHTWDKAFIDHLLGDQGSKQPWDFYPIQLADAFIDEYKDTGGVVAFFGTIEDGDPLESEELKPIIEEAKVRMYTWAAGKVREAESYWNDNNGQMKMAIDAPHRLCAQLLFDNRRLGKLPEWMAVFERNDVDISEPCPACRVEPKKGAAICTTTNCGYILDPSQAFILELITEEHLSLERLTRAQVEALGISSFVAETKDERPARLAKGLGKPLSAFQQQAAGNAAA